MGTFSVGTPFTLTVTVSSLIVMSLKRCSDTGVILLSSPSRVYRIGKRGGMTQYWKSDLPHCPMFSAVLGPKLEAVPKLTNSVMLPSNEYRNAIVGPGSDVAGNVEREGGSSLAVRV